MAFPLPEYWQNHNPPKLTYDFPWNRFPETQRYERLSNQEHLFTRDPVHVRPNPSPFVPNLTLADPNMRDYLQRLKDGTPPSNPAEAIPTEMDVAVAQARKFISILTSDLAKESWSDCNFVTPFWNILGDQLTRLFHLREQWKKLGKLSELSIGYHYTTTTTIDSVRKLGLLTQKDRAALGVAENFCGAALGDGVYTGNDPVTFYRFRPDATCGIIVLRLMGLVDQERNSSIADTIWRHLTNSCQRDIVNIRTTEQCAVLFEYDGNQVKSDRGKVYKLLRLQTYFEQLIDKLFGNDLPRAGPLVPMKRSSQMIAKLLKQQTELYHHNDVREFSFSYCAPQYQAKEFDTETTTVAVTSSGSVSGTTCPICLGTLSDNNFVQIQGCSHTFHEKCMKEVAEKYNVCPICRHWFKVPKGPMPSGNMTISFDQKLRCSTNGHRSGKHTGTIKLGYYITHGMRKAYHGSGVFRGKCFRAILKTGYLPDTAKGRQLLRRLVYAFLHGLTFKVEDPRSHIDDEATTFCIPHQERLNRNMHPYLVYMVLCHLALDKLGVPPSDSKALEMPAMAEINQYLEWRKAYTSWMEN